LKRIVVIFAKQHQRSNRSSTTKVHLNELVLHCCYFTLQNETLSYRYTTTPKGTKFHKKNKSLSVHIVELSTAVVKS